MTKVEKKELKEVFIELENLMTTINPNLKQFSDSVTTGAVNLDTLTITDVKTIIDLIRLQTKYLLLDVEASRREINSLSKILDKATGGDND
jgi:hypothetical protein